MPGVSAAGRGSAARDRVGTGIGSGLELQAIRPKKGETYDGLHL